MTKIQKGLSMAKAMNPITKKAYKVEFETTNISLEDLIQKYKIDTELLGSTESWEKRSTAITEVLPPKPAPAEEDPGTELVEYDMVDEIYDTKKLVLASVKTYFEEDGEHVDASTKEIKDMVGVLKDLESGELAKKGQGGTGTTINVAIQNVVERFKDDC